jgi:hypothetical protein
VPAWTGVDARRSIAIAAHLTPFLPHP